MKKTKGHLYSVSLNLEYNNGENATIDNYVHCFILLLCTDEPLVFLFGGLC